MALLSLIGRLYVSTVASDRGRLSLKVVYIKYLVPESTV